MTCSPGFAFLQKRVRNPGQESKIELLIRQGRYPGENRGPAFLYHCKAFLSLDTGFHRYDTAGRFTAVADF